MSPKTVNWPGYGPIPVPGFGAMGMSAFYGQTNYESSQATLRKAIEIGCIFWNTADMYGNGHNEELIGSVLKEPGNREKVFLVTKFGNRLFPDGTRAIDGSKEYVHQAIDASIKRLGTTPDAWAAHRIDKKVPIEETVGAMEEVRKAGKTKYLGLSECSAETLRRASKVAKIHFIEVEYSPWTLDMEENGVLAAAKELGIIVLAYSPLGRGFLTGRFKKPEDFATSGDVRSQWPRMKEEVWEHNYKLVVEFERLAKKKECTPGQLALAWLMAQGDNIIPIPGTKSEKYIVENFASRDVELTKEELEEMRAVINEHKPKGLRYPEAYMATLDSHSQ